MALARSWYVPDAVQQGPGLSGWVMGPDVVEPLEAVGAAKSAIMIRMNECKRPVDVMRLTGTVGRCM